MTKKLNRGIAVLLACIALSVCVSSLATFEPGFGKFSGSEVFSDSSQSSFPVSQSFGFNGSGFDNFTSGSVTDKASRAFFQHFSTVSS